MIRLKRAFLVLVITVVAGLGGWYAWSTFLPGNGGLPGKLFRYYPESSAFYMELTPGQMFVDGFVHHLQQQIKKTTKQHAIETDKLITKQRANDYRRLFLDKFNSTFKPYISVGIWASAPEKALKKGELPVSNALIVLPIKERYSILEIMQRFGLSVEAFEQKSDESVVYITEKSSGHSMAVVEQNLFITNHAAAMKKSLQHHQQKKRHIFQNPALQPYLSQLAKDRQGTIILNNESYLEQNSQKNHYNPVQFQSVAHVTSVHEQEFRTLFPLTVASVHFNDIEQQINSHWISPIQLEKLASENESQRFVESLKQFLEPTTLPSLYKEDSASFIISVANLDYLFDTYKASHLPAKSKQWFKLIDMGLGKVNLDLRQDIIALLSGRTTFMGVSSETANNTRKGTIGLVAQLEKQPEKQILVNKIEKLMTTKQFPFKVSTKQMNGHSFQSVVYGLNQAFMYGSVDDSFIFSTPEVLSNLVLASPGIQSMPSQYYQAVIHDMPDKSNILAYINVDTLRKQKQLPQAINRLPEWLQAIGISMWATPNPKQEDTLSETSIHSQLNFQLKLEQP